MSWEVCVSSMTTCSSTKDDEEEEAARSRDATYVWGNTAEKLVEPNLLPNHTRERIWRLPIEILSSVVLFWYTLYKLANRNQGASTSQTKSKPDSLESPSSKYPPPAFPKPTNKQRIKASGAKQAKNKMGGIPKQSVSSRMNKPLDNDSSANGIDLSHGKMSNASKERPAVLRFLLSWFRRIAAFVLALVGAFLIFFVVVLFRSSNNHETGNAVFQAPILTRSETYQMLNILEHVAARNYHNVWEGGVDYSRESELLSQPYGWRKFRHKGYPTTDLSVRSDPFSDQDKAWMSEIMNRRLSPILSRIYDIPVGSIRASDLFFVRYDHDIQSHLERHQDTSDISINLLLTEDFDGGGTKFWNNLTSTTFAHVEPDRAGTAVIHRGSLEHEGHPVSRGIRIILVAFLVVDPLYRSNAIDNWVSTGVSVWSSWFDWTWALLRIDYLRPQDSKICRYLVETLGYIIVRTFKYHEVPMIVKDANREAFLRALDCSYDQRQETDPRRLKSLYWEKPMWDPKK